MQCPDCGYMMTPFDKVCPRCEALASKKVKPAGDEQDIIIHLDPPRSRTYAKWIGLCVVLPLLYFGAIRLRATIIKSSEAPLRPSSQDSDTHTPSLPAPGYDAHSSDNRRTAMSPPTLQPSQVNVQANQEAQKVSALDRQVQDYNNLLRQAQDANRNALSAMKMSEDEFGIAYQSIGTPDHDKIMQDAKDSGDREVQYAWEVVRCLKQALNALPQIKSNTLFLEYYQETNICLTYEHIPTDLLKDGADKLRFIERR